jgi:nitrogenase-associated protein
MAKVEFYEKPGCGGNARQKALLVASGHEIEARNLLTEPWTAARLRTYFGQKPVREWFNAAAPRVKSGDIKIDEVTPDAALAMMVEQPLLIRRPLMKVGGRCVSGFDQAEVDAWIGLKKTERPVSDVCLKVAAE